MPALILSTPRPGLFDFRHDCVAVSASGRVGLMAGIEQPKLAPVICVNVTVVVYGLQCRDWVIIDVTLSRARRSEDTWDKERGCCLRRSA